jgi:hypothetical protein
MAKPAGNPASNPANEPVTDPAGGPVAAPTSLDSFAWHRRIVARRLDRIVGDVRELADALERLGGDLDLIVQSPTGDVEVFTYDRIAARAVAAIMNALPNLGLDALVTVATEADVARQLEAAIAGTRH